MSLIAITNIEHCLLLGNTMTTLNSNWKVIFTFYCGVSHKDIPLYLINKNTKQMDNSLTTLSNSIPWKETSTEGCSNTTHNPAVAHAGSPKAKKQINFACHRGKWTRLSSNWIFQSRFSDLATINVTASLSHRCDVYTIYSSTFPWLAIPTRKLACGPVPAKVCNGSPIMPERKYSRVRLATDRRWRYVRSPHACI